MLRITGFIDLNLWNVCICAGFLSQLSIATLSLLSVGKANPSDHRKVPVLSGCGLGQANGGLGRKTERREEVRSESMSPGSLFARSLPSD